jgi:TatD DNase family protein
MLVDTHCHLDWGTYQDDLGEVLGRAKDAGVEKLVTIGTDLESNQKSRELVRKYESVYRCVGFHPDTVMQEGFDDAQIKENLRKMSAELDVENTVGIGEVGLDYYVMEQSGVDVGRRAELVKLQKELFERQLLVALKEGLPVSVHVRDSGEDAYWDTLEILSEYYGAGLQVSANLNFAKDVLEQEVVQSGEGSFGFMQDNEMRVPGVLHCISGPLEYVQRCVAMGFMIGICGNVTYKKSEWLEEIVRAISIENMVLETDAPFLAPVPNRGKRNESAWMVETAKRVAQIKNVTLEEVERVTSENAIKLFGLDVR